MAGLLQREGDGVGRGARLLLGGGLFGALCGAGGCCSGQATSCKKTVEIWPVSASFTDAWRLAQDDGQRLLQASV